VPPGEPPPDRGRYNGGTVTVAAFTCLAFVTLAAAYATALRLLVRMGDAEAIGNDDYYFAIHGLALVVACVMGFAIGTYARSMGFAFATLFVAAMLVVMMGAQVASFELACAGHNEIIRRWSC
jgi:hypothetical protein